MWFWVFLSLHACSATMRHLNWSSLLIILPFPSLPSTLKTSSLAYRSIVLTITFHRPIVSFLDSCRVRYQVLNKSVNINSISFVYEISLYQVRLRVESRRVRNKPKSFWFTLYFLLRWFLSVLPASLLGRITALTLSMWVAVLVSRGTMAERRGTLFDTNPFASKHEKH